MKAFLEKMRGWSRKIYNSSGVSENELARNYAAMGNVQLNRINPHELTPEARRLWQAEKARRQRSQPAPGPL